MSTSQEPKESVPLAVACGAAAGGRVARHLLLQGREVHLFDVTLLNLLDLLDQSDGFLGEARTRHLVGEADENRDRLILFAGFQGHVREPKPHARVKAALAEVGLEHLDGPFLSGRVVKLDRTDRGHLRAAGALDVVRLELVAHGGVRLGDRVQGFLVQLEQLARIRGCRHRRGAGAAGQHGDLAEEVALLEDLDEDVAATGIADVDLDPADRDGEEALSGLMLADHDFTGSERPELESVNDGEHRSVVEVPEQRAGEETLGRIRGLLLFLLWWRRGFGGVGGVRDQVEQVILELVLRHRVGARLLGFRDHLGEGLVGCVGSQRLLRRFPWLGGLDLRGGFGGRLGERGEEPPEGAPTPRGHAGVRAMRSDGLLLARLRRDDASFSAGVRGDLDTAELGLVHDLLVRRWSRNHFLCSRRLIVLGFLVRRPGDRRGAASALDPLEDLIETHAGGVVEGHRLPFPRDDLARQGLSFDLRELQLPGQLAELLDPELRMRAARRVERRGRGSHRRGVESVLFLYESRQLLLDLGARRDLLDPLEDRDRLGDEVVSRKVVRQLQEERDGFHAAAGQDEDIGQLEANRDGGGALGELLTQDLDGPVVLLAGDQVR